MKIGSFAVFLTFLLAFASGCTENPSQNTMSLSFSIENFSNDTIHLWQTELIGFSKINEYEIILNQSGSGALEVEYPDNSFFNIQIGNLILPMIYSQNKSLSISGDASDLLGTIIFDGNEAIYAEYSKGKEVISREYDTLDGLAFFQLDSSDFWIRINAFNKDIDSLNNWLIENGKNDQLNSLLILESLQQSYIYILNYALVKGFRSSKYNIDIPYNKELLHSNSTDYGAVLSFNFDLWIEPMLWEKSGTGENDSIRYFFSQVLIEQIGSLPIPDYIQEHYIARHLAYSFGANQSNPITEDVYAKWLENNPNSQHKSLISRLYNRMSSLSKGVKAPEISGIYPDGNIFEFKNFLDNVVYVDVWATWCPGCIEKLPYMDSIQSEFESNSSVKFLYVSMDKDLDKWKNYISKLPEDGININSSGTNLYQDYMIHGIPRYMIIDKSGIIYDSNAPDPDSEEILRILKELE